MDTSVVPASERLDSDLARPLGLGSLKVSDRRFLIYLATFTSLLWASLTSGAFFHVPLTVFCILAVLAGAVAVGLDTGRATGPVTWWAVTVAPMVVAIVAAAAANHALADAPYALVPAVVAFSFGVVGCLAARAEDRRLLLGIVVDVTTVLALLSWLGVAAHWSRFATLEAEGWRASATIGYANVTGVVMLIGLLCAANKAAHFGRPQDDLRCWVLATGVLATQSRSAALALVLAIAILFVLWRPMAKVLVWSAGWAVVALAGLLPSIRYHSPQVAAALVAAAVGAAAVAGLRRRAARSYALRVWIGGLFLATIVATAVGLHSRIGDGASDQGRMKIWRDAVHQIVNGSVFGQGPRQLADLSRGHLGPLLTHNDPLQYAKYYGALGVLALAFAVWRLARAVQASRAAVPPDLWATAVTLAVAVGCVALVDFPLQVPIVPSLLALVVGATLQPGAISRGHQGVASLAGGREVVTTREVGHASRGI